MKREIFFAIDEIHKIANELKEELEAIGVENNGMIKSLHRKASKIHSSLDHTLNLINDYCKGPVFTLSGDELLTPYELIEFLLMIKASKLIIMGKNQETWRMEEIDDLVGLVSHIRRFQIPKEEKKAAQ